MKTFFLSLLSGLLVGLLAVTQAFATHLRAGEITTRRVSGSSSLTYEITLTTYHDEVGGRTASDQQDEVTIFCFGVGGPQTVPRIFQGPISATNRATSINIYRTTFTYPGPGTYNITCTITNRNEGTRNIPNSVNTSFQLRTTIVVNANLGLNSTPVLLNPPLDSARVGQKFCHNPAAFDVDGDSLAYRLYTPSGRLSDVSNACATEFVDRYLKPETIGSNPVTESGSGPATLTVDPITGDVCWDAPAEQGQYNIAFIIEEWRNGVKIGEIVRDMQIIVTPSTNRRPTLQPPNDLCVVAGTVVSQTITATDPEGNRLELTAYGGPFNVGPNGQPLTDAQGRAIQLISPPVATFTPAANQPQGSPASGTFRWPTSCVHVRNEPYDVVLRVVDFPRQGQTQLATLESFKIRVFAPQPQNLTARAAPAAGQGRAITLNWDAYGCGGALPSGVQMVIYRKEGCEPLAPQQCPPDAPPPGYTQIASVGIGQTTYTDNNNGQGLKRGVQYSYVIVAVFPRPGNGRSVVSQQVCVNLPQQVPVLTNVTVDTTDAARGVITVRWTRPLGVNPNDLGGPFQYRLFRATGLTDNNFAQVATINTNLSPAANDTVFVDRGLNTVQNPYRYRLEFYFTDPATGQLTRLDATEAASSVRLAATPAIRSIRLSWQAVTPWSNDNQTHRIYRSRTGPNGPFNRIADVPVTGPNSYTFTDSGADTFLADGNTSTSLSVDSSYCYRVETVGSYNDNLIRPALLFNFSQGVCASPIDTLKPCPPQLSLDSLVCSELTAESLCNQTSFENRLSWTAPVSAPGCDPNVVQYKVYYNRYSEEEEGQELTAVAAPTLTFTHQNLTTVAGCYVVTAISRSGAESAPSNRVCNETCPELRLPNVLTPNGDGKNDVFQPLPCPRFIETAELVVYNRWGAKVYEGAGLVWEGKTRAGQDLPAGLYYYQATVRFSRLSRSAPPQVYKGWVEILREGISGK